MRDGWDKQSGNQCFRKVLLVLTHIIADLEAHLLDGAAVTLTLLHLPSTSPSPRPGRCEAPWLRAPAFGQVPQIRG